MSHRTEFPGFGVDVAIPAGFVDESYKNDACPRFIHEGAGLALWIDHRDPSQREFRGRRFMLARWDMKRDRATGPMLFSTDSWLDMTKKIEKVLSRRKNPGLNQRFNAAEVISAQGLHTVEEAYEFLLDDRSHGSEDIAEATNLVWKKMSAKQRKSRSSLDLETFVARVIRLATRMGMRANPSSSGNAVCNCLGFLPKHQKKDHSAVWGRYVTNTQSVRQVCRECGGKQWTAGGKGCRRCMASGTTFKPSRTNPLYGAASPGDTYRVVAHGKNGEVAYRGRELHRTYGAADKEAQAISRRAGLTDVHIVKNGEVIVGEIKARKNPATTPAEMCRERCKQLGISFSVSHRHDSQGGQQIYVVSGQPMTPGEALRHLGLRWSGVGRRPNPVKTFFCFPCARRFIGTGTASQANCPDCHRVCQATRLKSRFNPRRRARRGR